MGRFLIVLDGDAGGDAAAWLARFAAARILPSAWLLEGGFASAGDVSQSLSDSCRDLRRALVVLLRADYAFLGQPLEDRARALMPELQGEGRPASGHTKA